MARSCKCKYCGKKLTTDVAFRSEEDKSYFCNQDEYNAWLQNKIKKKKETLLKKNICGVMGRTCGMIIQQYSWNEINTTISLLSNKYSLEEIYEYVDAESGYIGQILSQKTFVNELNKVRYYTAIVKNNIDKYYDLDTIDVYKNVSQSKEIDFYMAPTVIKNKIIKKSMADYENEDDEDDEINV